jgi:hypothetical protein
MRTACCLLLLALAAPPVLAEKKPRQPAQPKVIPSGSEESAAARDKRLKRECRGRPNAGACAGYTR